MNRGKSIVLCLLIVSLIVTGVVLRTKSPGVQRLTILCPADAAEAFEALVGEYRSGGNGLNIVIEKTETADHIASVERRFSDKHPPDMAVFTLDTGFGTMQAASRFMDLAGMPGAFEAPVYTLPLCGDIPLIFYNKQLFAGQKLFEPESLNSFFNVCSYFQMMDICPLGIASGRSGTGDIAPLVDCLLVNAPDFDSIGEDDQIGYGVCSDLLSVIETMRNMGIFAQEHAADRGRLFEEFKKGTYPMVLGSYSDIALLEKTDIPFEYGAFLLFGNSMVNRGVLIPTLSFSVRAGAERPIRDFAQFLLSEKGEEMIRSRFGAFTPGKTPSQQSDIEKELCGKLEIAGTSLSFLESLEAAQRELFLDLLNKAVAGENIDARQLCNTICKTRDLEGGK